MGLESVTYVNDLNVANPLFNDPKSEGDDHLRNIKTALKNTFPGMAGRAWRFQSKSGAYTVVGTDNMTVLNCTATFTLSLTAAATLGDGFCFVVSANGGDVTIDPNGAETIEGVTSILVTNGSIALVFCNGTSFFAFKLARANTTDWVIGGITTGAATDLTLKTSGGVQFRAGHVASAVNHLAAYGGATASGVSLQAIGTDTDISIQYTSKGAGFHYFYTHAAAGVAALTLEGIGSTPSNGFKLTPATAGNGVSLSANGTDANIGIALLAKGTGIVSVSQSGSNGTGAFLVGNSHASLPYGIQVFFSGASPDNNTQWFQYYADSTTSRAVCYSDGDWVNHDGTYGTISDETIKSGITPASNQLADVKALSAAMVNYETEFSPGKKLLGWKAQEVQAISPGCVRHVKWGGRQLLATDDMTILKKGFRSLAEIIQRLEAIEAKLP